MPCARQLCPQLFHEVPHDSRGAADEHSSPQRGGAASKKEAISHQLECHTRRADLCTPTGSTHHSPGSRPPVAHPGSRRLAKTNPEGVLHVASGWTTPSGNAVKDFCQSKTWKSKNGEIEEKPDSSSEQRHTHPSERNLAHVWQGEIEECKDQESPVEESPDAETAKRGGGTPVAPTNAQQMRAWLKWWLRDDTSFADLKRHGNTK